MRALSFARALTFLFLSLIVARPALADFDPAAGYWKLLGQQSQVPQLLNLRGTRDIAILEVVGDCGGQLCSWGATRADLLFDANGNVSRWQAFLENGDDFHEFDAFMGTTRLMRSSHRARSPGSQRAVWTVRKTLRPIPFLTASHMNHRN